MEASEIFAIAMAGMAVVVLLGVLGYIIRESKKRERELKKWRSDMHLKE